jgi:hypothetical protein
VICPFKNVVKFLLLFKPGKGIRKVINAPFEQLVKLEKDIDRFISVTDIKRYVNSKKAIITIAGLPANVTEYDIVV